MVATRFACCDLQRIEINKQDTAAPARTTAHKSSIGALAMLSSRRPGYHGSVTSCQVAAPGAALSLSRTTPAAHRRTRLAVALDELGPLLVKAPVGRSLMRRAPDTTRFDRRPGRTLKERSYNLGVQLIMP